jgi:hypothetical protein
MDSLQKKSGGQYYLYKTQKYLGINMLKRETLFPLTEE